MTEEVQRFNYLYRKILCDEFLKLSNEKTEMIIKSQKSECLFWALEMIKRLKKLNPPEIKHKPINTGLQITFY